MARKATQVSQATQKSSKSSSTYTPGGYIGADPNLAHINPHFYQPEQIGEMVKQEMALDKAAGRYGFQKPQTEAVPTTLETEATPTTTSQAEATPQVASPQAQAPQAQASPLTTSGIESTSQPQIKVPDSAFTDSATPEQAQARKDFFGALDAQQRALDQFAKLAPKTPEAQKADSDSHGFDTSDKMSMLGSLLVSGGAGFFEAGSRAVQLGADGLEKIGVAPVGLGDKWTNFFNRQEAKSELLQNAIHSHPIMSWIGRTAGNMAAVSLAIAGVVALLPEEATAGIASLLGTSGVGLAKLLVRGSEAGKAIMSESAAQAIINASKMGKFIKSAQNFGRDFLLGQTFYNDQNAHSLSQGIGFGIGGAALRTAGRGIKALAGATAREIKEVAEKWGISLPFNSAVKKTKPEEMIPLYPQVEQFAKHIPMGGYPNAMVERGEAVAAKAEAINKGFVDPAEKTTQGEDFSTYLTGQLKKAHEMYEKLDEINYDKITNEVKNKGYVVMDKLKQAAKEIYAKQIKTAGGFQNSKLRTIVDDLMGKGEATAETKPIKPTLILPQRLQEQLQTEAENHIPLMKWEAFRDTMKRIGNGTKLEADPELSYAYNYLYSKAMETTEDHLMKVSPQTLDKFYDAANFHKNFILPFKPGHQFYSYSKEGLANPDNFVGKFLKPDSPYNLKQLIKMLPPGNERNILVLRGLISKEAWQNSFNPGSGINPLKYIGEIRRLGKTLNVAFSKEQNETLEGFEKLIGKIKSISPDALNPDVYNQYKKTGVWLSHWHMAQLAGAAMGVDYGFHHGWGMASMLPLLLAPVAFSRLVTSGTGRKLMVHMFNFADKMNHKEMDSMLVKILDVVKNPAATLTKAAAGEAARNF